MFNAESSKNIAFFATHNINNIAFLDHRMRITIKIPKKPNLELNLRPHDTVVNIKNQIFETFGLFSILYKLHFNGYELDDGLKCLKDYGVKAGSIIDLSHWNAQEVNKEQTFKLNTE